MGGWAGQFAGWTASGAVCFLVFSSAGQSADWPQWRGPNRDGISTENLSLVWPPKVLWRKYVGVGFSGVSISEGRLYTMGWGGGYDYVYCLNATNPNIGYWTNVYAAARFGPGSQAIVFADSGVYGVKATNGAVVFSYPWIYGQNRHCADPIIYNNKFFISDDYGGGCALAPFGSGVLTSNDWKNANMNSHFCNSVLLDNYVYGADGIQGSSSLACLDIRDGSKKWSTCSPQITPPFLCLRKHRNPLRFCPKS
jgi:hypothetical protein